MVDRAGRRTYRSSKGGKMNDKELIESLKAKLKEAIELAEAAAKGSPYPQTPHFWKRLHELKNGNTNS